MANEEHLAKLKEGVEAWNAWRAASLSWGESSKQWLEGHPEARPDLRDADLGHAELRDFDLSFALLQNANLEGAILWRAILQGAHLEGAKLRTAKLKGANLMLAHLEGADLRADLEGADLGVAFLTGANLNSAMLEGGRLEGAILRDADLGHARLRGVNLIGAHLEGACLQGADFENADLRGTKGFVLDACRVRGTKFSPGSRDPWSVLRRHYTGPMFLLHLLLLVAFVVPYLAKTLMWVGVNRSQDVMIQAQARIEATATVLEVAGDPNAAVLRQLAGDLGQLKPCLAAECREYRVWQLLVGVDKGPRFWALALALLLYNVSRGILTWKVGPLRDEEERSGYSPALSDYRWLSRVHQVVRVLLVVALAALAFHLWEWLWNTTVWIPAA